MLPTQSAARALPQLKIPQYDPVIRCFNEWLAGRPVTEETVREFFQAQERAGYSARSLRLHKVAIKAAIRHAFPSHDSRVDASLDAFFRSLKTPRPETHIQEGDIFSRDELKMLITASPHHVGLFIQALYNTGARISELLSVRLSKCERDRTVIRCRITGKGKRERTLILDRKLFESIRIAFPSKDFLFANEGRPYSRQHMAREMKRHSREILSRDIHPHALRHSRVTHLLAAGKPLEAVSKFAGHTRVDTTVRFYAHNILQVQEILATGL
jgi:site-specific recombinase XerD